MLNICREAQKSGYYIYYYDTEGAVDIDAAVKFGIDPSKFHHEPLSDLGIFRTSITTLTKTLMEAKKKGMKIPKIMVCLDSLGMLATSKEIDDAMSGSDKADMTRAKSIRSLFRIITSDLTGLHIPFLFTNHTYASTGMFPTINLSGGGGLVYAASVIINLTKAKLKDDKNDGKIQTGIICSAKTLKNRFAKPHDIKFHIHFSRGMNPYVGMEEYISWDTCGIEKGQVVSEKDYLKASEKEKEKHRKFTDENGKIVYFYPKETARNFVVKHLGKGILPNELFTKEVFTREILEMINNKCIAPKWTYGEGDDMSSEIDDLIDDERIGSSAIRDEIEDIDIEIENIRMTNSKELD
mgnify:FL=1